MTEGGQEQASTSERTASGSIRVGHERKESCTPYFDKLWFCYSPVHQVKQYYIYGNVDDCTGHWREFYNCLKKRTRFKDEVPEDPRFGQHPVWEIRTHEEARAFWDAEFVHLSGQPEGQQEPQQREAAEAAVGAGEAERHGAKATLA